MGHITPYERAREIVATLVDALPSGSHLVLGDGVDTDPAGVESMKLYADSGAIPYNLRSPEEITAFFDGLEPVEPGLTSPTRWRAEDPAPWPNMHDPNICGVARKP
ncbi:SAM-dependent methyltransferase [Thermomonospora cellulosilytica]|uniref:Uncharacterized protein n=2 Tax=Thermomonospora TaxID=2019 RepID=A0A7W3MXV3_9ACTN|nr:SAM-dependent methyltransferase [Thermomonospora cellulosilytica]MBA9003924.1 hypothetical protein [Thermomonospora cellulosilytica]